MSTGNGGVSIGINANAAQATSVLGRLVDQISKVKQASRDFGLNPATIKATNRELESQQRRLVRLGAELKAVTKAYSDLARQSNALGPNHPQADALSHGLKQLGRRQVRLQGSQLASQAVIANLSAVTGAGGGGGGLGMLGFLTGLMGKGGAIGGLLGGLGGAAGGPGSMLIGALGGSLFSSVGRIAGKAVMTAAEEDRLYTRLISRQAAGHLDQARQVGFMNNFRDKMLPIGYSGIDSLKIATGIGPASREGSALQNDTYAAGAFARLFGMDAEQTAGKFASVGTAGAFKPGDARRFAEMLAKSIKQVGLTPRAQEVEEATLTIMRRQLSTTTRANAGAAIGLTALMNGTGVPAFQGAAGASVLGTLNNAVQNNDGDEMTAVLEQALRLTGKSGLYNVLSAKSKGLFGDPHLFGAILKVLRANSGGDPNRMGLMMRQWGVPFDQGVALAQQFPHPSVDMVDKALARVKAGKGTLDDKSLLSVMNLSGNKLDKTQAILTDAMARAGAPAVHAFESLGAGGADMLNSLFKIADHSDWTNKILREIEGLLGGHPWQIGKTTPFSAAVTPHNGPFRNTGGAMDVRNAPKGGQPSGVAVGPLSRLLGFAQANGLHVNSGEDRGIIPHSGHAAHSLHYQGRAIDVSVRGMSAARRQQIMKAAKAQGIGGWPELYQGSGPHGMSSGPHMHLQIPPPRPGKIDLHVTFDQGGHVHPVHKQQFQSMVHEAMKEMVQWDDRSDTHRRWSR